MRRLCALTIVVIASCPLTSKGDVVLQESNGLTVTLSESKAWTIGKLQAGPHSLMHYPGSAQGTVIKEDGEWAGSGHGNEEVLSSQLWIDGKQTPFHNNTEYNGNSFTFQRETRVGDTYQLASCMQLSNAKLTETVTLTRTDSQKNVGVAYGLLGTRDNELTQYASFASDGQILAQGTTDQDDRSFVHFPGAAAVAQYNPTEGVGIVTTINEGHSLDLDLFIWDTSVYNKFYARCHELEGVQPAGTTFTIKQSIIPFESTLDSWTQTAANQVPEPSSMIIMCVAALPVVMRSIIRYSRKRPAAR